MGPIMIRCPRTGRDIETGFVVEHSTFRSLPVFFARSYCAYCRAEHEWFAKDAWVCEPADAVGVQAA